MKILVTGGCGIVRTNIALFLNKNYNINSLNNLTKICQKITKNKIEISKQTKTSIYDIPYYITNNNLISKTYKWKPKKNIYNVVMNIYMWLSNNKNNLKKYF